MYFRLLTMVMWITLKIIIDVGVSVNMELEPKHDIMRLRDQYDEDEDIDDDDIEESKNQEISPRATVEFAGIYGKCNGTLDTFTVVVAQGGCLLIYDPLYHPYGCWSVSMMASGCESVDIFGVCDGKYKRNYCFEVEFGWYWFWGGSRMSKKQSYKFYVGNTQQLFQWRKLKNTGGFPLMPSKVIAYLYPGRIKVYIKNPDFEGKNVPRQALGYRVSVLDTTYTQEWDVQTNLESVVYRCTFPELKPIHPCPRYRKDKTFCVLLAESIYWTNMKASTGPKFVRVDSYFLPQFQENRWYSSPYIVIPVAPPQPPPPEGPMFGYGNTTFPRKPPGGALTFWHPWLILCLVLAALILFLIFGGIPLVIYLSARAARREAEERWREWADAPGNVGIGLGADPVAWYGTPPWSMRPKVPNT